MYTQSVPEAAGKSTGKFTKIPNSFLDQAHLLTGAGWPLFAYIIRETIGFHRESVQFSLAGFAQSRDMSKRTILRASQRLQELGWIAVEGAERAVQTYRIICPSGDKNVTSETNVAGQKCHQSGDKNVTSCVTKMSPAYKEYKETLPKKDLKKSSSLPSSEREPDRSTEQAATRTMSPPDPAPPKPDTEAAGWWDSEDRADLQDELNAVKPFGSCLQYPSWPEVIPLLKYFESRDDFQTWLSVVKHRDMRAAKFWAFYQRPAQGWPTQRAGYLAERQRERAISRAWEEQQAASTLRIVESRTETISPPKPVPPPPPKRVSRDRLAELEDQLALQRDSLIVFAKFPDMLQPFRVRIAELEAEIAGLKAAKSVGAAPSRLTVMARVAV